jgi:glyoxylase-like metal-dependent hydrolase (beta-lactamase superfamily II)
MLRCSLACLLLSAVSLPPAHALQPIRVGEGVYAFIGDLGEIGPDNGGDIGNSGFIVGSSGVVVIDTGASFRHGKAMIEAIRRISDKPVKLVVNTHAVQEFLLGNAAFAELGAPLLAHAKTAALMRERCQHCLDNLRKILGPQAMAGTRLVLPETTVAGSTTLEAAGRSLELLYFGWASTPGDMAVLDRDSGVLFAGGLVSAGRIPVLRDAKLDGWLQALDQLGRVRAGVIVPGHGSVGGPEIIRATASYLRALDEKVQALYKAGAGLIDVLDVATLPAYAGWSMYPSVHRQNVLHRYLQLEVEDLGG